MCGKTLLHRTANAKVYEKYISAKNLGIFKGEVIIYWTLESGKLRKMPTECNQIPWFGLSFLKGISPKQNYSVEFVWSAT